MANVPPSRPAQTEPATVRALRGGGVKPGTVALLGVRGYYRDTMGAAGRNDRGIYDDAIFLHSPNVHAAFNANTDPSAFRKGIASLLPGLWLYKVGTHGLSKPAALRYTALVQAGEVAVARDSQGDGGRIERGEFGINIHRGGVNGTGSLGCQTIHPSQWPAFIALVQAELKRAGQKTIPYLLTENA